MVQALRFCLPGEVVFTLLSHFKVGLVIGNNFSSEFGRSFFFFFLTYLESVLCARAEERERESQAYSTEPNVELELMT